jgi:D-glycero-D-manno-heptose 1,7-bisphosphate phosphatase
VSSGYGDAEMIFEKSKQLMPEIQMFKDLASAADAILQDKS